MAHDIFISYSSIDKDKVEIISGNLEKAGFSCWYAPRDIQPGQEWVSAINNAIEETSVFLFIYTENSNASRQVHNEIALAFNAQKILIPFRLTDVPMNSEIKYYMTRVHWLDAANQPFEKGIRELIEVVGNALWEDSGSLRRFEAHPRSDESGMDDATKKKHEPNGKASKSKRIMGIIICGLAVFAILIAFSSVKLAQHRKNRPEYFYHQGYAAWQAEDYLTTKENFEKAADAGNLMAKLALGTIWADDLQKAIEKRDLARDVRSEGERLKKLGEELVQGGLAEGNYLIGYYYAEGIEGARDKAMAISYFEQAIQGKDKEWLMRCYGYLCLLHSSSNSEIPASMENVEHYAQLVQKMLDEDREENYGIRPAYALVSNQIGEAYRNMGEGTEAARWYRRAANLGIPSAMNQLGLAYLRGDGVEENADVARNWFQKAADAGDENAKSNLEYMDR